ncbi:catalase [Bacillus subtilis]|nr:catalase [Bacillus subtilis]
MLIMMHTRYRVGANHQALPINRAPQQSKTIISVMGKCVFDDNGGGSVYYEPNSFGGPKESPEDKQAAYPVQGIADSVSYDHYDHYTQAGDLYRLMSEDERTRPC